MRKHKPTWGGLLAALFVCAFLFNVPNSANAKDSSSLYSEIASLVLKKIPIIKPKYKVERQDYFLVLQVPRAKIEIKAKQFPYWEASFKPATLKAEYWPTERISFFLKGGYRWKESEVKLGITIHF